MEAPPIARLVFSHEKGLKDEAGFSCNNICELTSSRKCIIPETSRKSFCQSPNSHPGGGWLVKICDDDDDDDDGGSSNPNCAYSSTNRKLGDCFLWNPVTLETIQLPTLLHWITNNSSDSEQYFLRRSVLSSPPLGNNLDGSASMVFFLFSPDGGDDFTTINATSSAKFSSFISNSKKRKRSNSSSTSSSSSSTSSSSSSSSTSSDSYLLVFCRPGDKKWRTQKLCVERCSIQSLICSKDDKLYIMCYNDRHLEIEIFDETLTIRPFNLECFCCPSVGVMCSEYQSQYVKSRDEIFRVIRHCYPGRVHDKVFEIHVYRMDMSLMVWEEMKSLGDHVLFLGERPTSTVYYSAADLGLTRGCVYYTMPRDNSLYKFDLEGNNIMVSLRCPNLPTPLLSPTDWIITPTTLRVTNTRRTRIKVMLDNNEEEDNIIVLATENRTSIKDYEEQQRQKTSRGEIEEAITLGILNEDILKLIASYLHPVDYIHFRSTCKANRSAIPAVKWRTSSVEFTTKTTSLSPWMVFYKKDDAIYNFVDPMHNNDKYLMNLSELLLGATIRFSKGGWLLMAKDLESLFFFNPFTRRKIELPDLPFIASSQLSSMSFSSLPTSSDCRVFAITYWSYMSVQICFIGRRGRWLSRSFTNTTLPIKEKDMKFKPSLSNPVFYCGAFYCLNVNGTLGVFGFKGDFTWTVLAKPKRPCNSFSQCYLVECEGNLLSVFLGILGKRFRIFRLDLSKKNWVKVESLGRHMLFISNTSCLSAIARDSRMENKVYFSRFHDKRIIFYSLDTDRYHSVGSRHSAENFYNTKEQLDCCWIEPNWS